MINLICIGIEGTAEKTGVGIVDSEGNILASQGNPLIPENGGIHPREAAEHHEEYWMDKEGRIHWYGEHPVHLHR